MKIPLLKEIQPFDNSVNPYSSISGHAVENRYFQKPAKKAMILSYFRNKPWFKNLLKKTFIKQ